MKQSSYVFFVSMFLFCITMGACGADMKIKENKAREIANREAKKLGYDIEIMHIKTAKYATPWNEYIPRDSNDEYYIEKMKELKNKEYWAVYYHPDREKIGEGYKGGDLCIFVDANTGDIITNILWK